MSAKDCWKIRNQSGFKRCLQLVILRSKRLRVKLAWSSPTESGMSFFIGHNRPNHTTWRLRGDQKHNQINEQRTKDIRFGDRASHTDFWSARWPDGMEREVSQWLVREHKQCMAAEMATADTKNNPDRRYGSRATWKSDPRPVVTQGS